MLSHLLSVFFVAFLSHTPPELDPINAVVGDKSLHALMGRAPTAAEDDAERIRLHLLWVEAQLRAHAEVPLSDAQRARRLALLDALHVYADGGAFPQRTDATPGRRPRFVDDQGRHCAVASLIRTSGHAELVASVQAAHEYDYVLDMHDAALLAWATEHGFAARELAMIQPSYLEGGSVDMPSPEEERQAEEARRRAALVPRDLEASHLREVLSRLSRLGDPTVALACAGDLAGHWTLDVELRVTRGLHTHVSVEARAVQGGAPMPVLQTCARGVFEQALRDLIASAAYRFGQPLRERVSFRIDVASRAETAAQLVARLTAGRDALRACFAASQPALGDAPVQLPVRVGGSSGQVQILWSTMPVTAMTTRSSEERTRFYCLQDVITYERIRLRAARELDFNVELRADGSAVLQP